MASKTIKIDDLQGDEEEAFRSEDDGEGAEDDQGNTSSRMAQLNVHGVSPQAEGPQLCGVGISFARGASGDIKITGIMPGSPASLSEALQINDVLVKVDGISVFDKSQEEIIKMVLGPPGTNVMLTIQSQYGYPHVMTAPFQVLPFDNKKQKKSKSRRAADMESENSFISPQNRLYGGGTLPKGFEHLESLRSAQPYTTPSLSVRTINLLRQLPARLLPGPMNAEAHQAFQAQIKQQQRSAAAGQRPGGLEQEQQHPQQSAQPHASQQQQPQQQPQKRPSQLAQPGVHQQQIHQHNPQQLGTQQEQEQQQGARANPSPALPMGLPEGYRMADNSAPGTRPNSGVHNNTGLDTRYQASSVGTDQAAKTKPASLQKEGSFTRLESQQAQASDSKKGAPPRPPPADALKPPPIPVMLTIAGVKVAVVQEVELAVSSLDSSLVCLLWLPSGQIFYWNGLETSTLQRVKGLEICNSMKDMEHGSKALIVRMEEGQEDDGFWSLLGATGRARTRQASQIDHAKVEQDAIRETIFIEFGQGQELVVGMDGPLKRSMLKQDKSYVIVAPSCRAYVWVGRLASKECSDAALLRAEAFVAQRKSGRCIANVVDKVMDGWEGTLFRCLFSDWMTACGTTAKLRGEGEGPIAVDSSIMARRTKAVLAANTGGDILYQIKGRKLVTCKEVGLQVSSMSHASVYVLDTKQCIYQWNGLQATPQEKTKAADICLSLRDHEHGGRAAIKVLDADGPDTRDGALFWGKINGDFSKVGSVKSEDGEYEERARNSIALFKVRADKSEGGDAMVRPYRHTMLDSDSAFVLSWEGEQLFVWTGNAAPQHLKEAAFTHASKMQKQWTERGMALVGIKAAPQHGEPALFRAHFQGWQQGLPSGGDRRDVSGERVVASPTAAVPSSPSVGRDKSTLLLEERASLVDIQVIEASGQLQTDLITPAVKHDDGSTGSLQVWRVMNGKLNQLGSSGNEGLGQGATTPLALATSGCYVLCYKFAPGVDKSQTRHVLYAWQGSEASKQDIAAATLCLNEVSSMVRGLGMQDRQVIGDGKETPHFLVACGRVLIVTNVRDDERGPEECARARLFEARFVAETAGVPVGKAVEVVCSAANLYSGSCYLVLLPAADKLAAAGQLAVFLWRGSFSVQGDSDVGRVAAARLVQQAKRMDMCVREVQEGNEPADFWKALGGQAEYRKMVDGVKNGRRVTRLFHLEMAGQMARPREIASPTKADLEETPSGACMIDTCCTGDSKQAHPGHVYLWYDERCTPVRLNACTAVVKRYIEARNARLGPSQVVALEPEVEVRGKESKLFTGLFHAWLRRASHHGGAHMAMAHTGAQGPPDMSKMSAAIATPKSDPGGKPMIFGLDLLQVPRDKLPPGVNAEAREVHLSDHDFQRAFGCSRTEFESYPVWKKTTKRKDAGLF